jgi:hypothetical protein
MKTVRLTVLTAMRRSKIQTIIEHLFAVREVVTRTRPQFFELCISCL